MKLLRLEFPFTEEEIDRLAATELRTDPRRPWSDQEKRKLARRALTRILANHSPVSIRGEG